MLEMYASLPKERKGLGGWTSMRTKIQVNGFDLSSDRCNMDPTSFIQPTLYEVSKLALHFRLTHLEIHSAQITATYIPNVKYFFGMAAELLMAMNPERISEHRDLYFGRLLLQMADGLRGAQLQVKQETPFAVHQYPKTPEKKQWYKIVA